jgi:Tol biopolymer transport system component
MGIGPGARLDSYEIVAPVASGGMGEVWLARDLRLDRKVALKLLPPRLSEDPDRVARFRQEARAASALNHPNVCTIYALGTAEDGRLFIAMEYIEGNTLRQLLAGDPVTVSQALDIAAQVASALAAAHDAGVIHRDVKPENVMMRNDGLVKVLDFGVAKLEPVAAAPGTTRTALRTHGETVLGTIAYMSPEQAYGASLDRRSDIFSLGAVLYEMVTGRQAFAGTSEAAVHDAILNRMPTSPLRLNPGLPPRLEDIVNKALEKDRDLRYQTAAELRTDLVRLKRDTDPGAIVVHGGERPAGASIHSPRRNWGVAVALALLLAAAGIVVIGWRSSYGLFRRPDPQEVQLTTNSSEAPVTAAAISPNGKYLAYADDGGIHIRVIDSRETHTIPMPESGGVNRLSWFPDGSKLLVSAEATTADKAQAIWSVSLIGGPRRKLRDNGIEASVSADGARVTFIDNKRAAVWLMGAAGEEPHQVVTGSTRDELHWPGFWWDGMRQVYGRSRVFEDKSGTLNVNVTAEARDADGHTTVLLSDPGLRGATRLPDGRLIYSLVAEPILNRSGSLWEVEADPQTGLPRGKPRQIPISSAGGALWQFSSTADGKRIAFIKRSEQMDVYIADLSLPTPVSPQRFTLDDSNDVATNWTPDSKAILFMSDRNGHRNIFKQSLDQRTPEVVVAAPDDESGPTAVTPDGDWFYYIVHPKGWTSTVLRPHTIMRTPAVGGPPQQLTAKPEFRIPLCARPPSRTCVLVEQNGTREVIYALDPIRGEGPAIASTDLGTNSYYAVDLSPDGSRVAIEIIEDRRIRIMSLQGEPVRDVTIPDRPLDPDSFHWSADSAGWYLASTSTTQFFAGTDLLHVDLNGSVTVVWHKTVPGSVAAIPSPDGRHLAITQGSLLSNVWMMRGF